MYQISFCNIVEHLEKNPITGVCKDCLLRLDEMFTEAKNFHIKFEELSLQFKINEANELLDMHFYNVQFLIETYEKKGKNQLEGDDLLKNSNLRFMKLLKPIKLQCFLDLIKRKKKK